MEKVKTVECLYAALSHSPVLVISLVTLSVFPFPDEVRNGYTFWINFLLAVPVDEDCFTDLQSNIKLK